MIQLIYRPRWPHWLFVLVFSSLLGACGGNTGPGATATSAPQPSGVASPVLTAQATLATTPLALQPTALASEMAAPSSGTTEAAVSISGLVWHDVCLPSGEMSGTAMPEMATPGGPPAPGNVPLGCTDLGNNTLQANGVRDPDEPGIAGVEVILYAGGCPASGPVVKTTKTAADGSYLFADLQPGAYCTGIDAKSEANAPILLPGIWTRPRMQGDTTIAAVPSNLAAGQSRKDADFGWNYQVAGTPAP